MGAKGAVEILYKSQSVAEVEARTAEYMTTLVNPMVAAQRGEYTCVYAYYRNVYVTYSCIV